MVIYSREKVARLREQYPAGTRIWLDSMDGEAGMPQGLEGTVQYVDKAVLPTLSTHLFSLKAKVITFPLEKR